MLAKKLAAAVFSVFCLLMISPSAFACACCSERGTYDVWTGKTDKYHLGLFKDIKFGGSADLFMTEAGFDSIRGLDALKKEDGAGTLENLNVVDIFTHNTWQLTIRSQGGKTGTLSLPLPATMTVFKADTHLKEE